MGRPAECARRASPRTFVRTNDSYPARPHRRSFAKRLALAPPPFHLGGTAAQRLDVRLGRDGSGTLRTFPEKEAPREMQRAKDPNRTPGGKTCARSQTSAARSTAPPPYPPHTVRRSHTLIRSGLARKGPACAGGNASRSQRKSWSFAGPAKPQKGRLSRENSRTATECRSRVPAACAKRPASRLSSCR